jgi:hypothetical protein
MIRQGWHGSWNPGKDKEKAISSPSGAGAGFNALRLSPALFFSS